MNLDIAQVPAVDGYLEPVRQTVLGVVLAPGLPSSDSRCYGRQGQGPSHLNYFLVIPIGSAQMGMHAASGSGPKNNPAEALRHSKQGVVDVLNRDHPSAVLLGLDQAGLLQAPGLRPP